MFLDYVGPQFVDRKAAIDGFNAIFSSVEGNRPDCIQVLHDYGINLEQRTEVDNQILPGATPLHLAAYYGRVESAQKLLSCGANVNTVDSINGQTALHIAVTQGHIAVILLLRNHNADITIKDKSGNTCATYCRNRSEIKDVLVDGALDIFMKLGKGRFSKAEQKQACEVLVRSAAIPGCLTYREALDIRGDDGSTMFMQSVIYSVFDVASTLNGLGVDIGVTNNAGISCSVYAHWFNNPRIKPFVPPLSDRCEEQLRKIRKASNVSAADGQVLFMSKLTEYKHVVASGINHRMNAIAIVAQPNGANIQIHPQLVWNAKLHVLNVVATRLDGDEELSATELFGLCHFSNNEIISQELNHAIQSGPPESIVGNNKQRIQLLLRALDKLPPFIGECFIGTDFAERKQFQVGMTVSFGAFLSGTTLWKVATENTPNFSTKKREGVVFIVKSLTGKFIGQYSEFGFDCEVLFRPYTKFKVTNWYHGDVFALAQSNIREHTFKVRSEKDRVTADGVIVGKNHNCDPLELMLENKKSLIIELQELENDGIKYIL